MLLVLYKRSFSLLGDRYIEYNALLWSGVRGIPDHVYIPDVRQCDWLDGCRGLYVYRPSIRSLLHSHYQGHIKRGKQELVSVL